MNGFDGVRKKDALASKTRLLQELEKLAARKKAIEKQLQLLRAKKVEQPPVQAPSVVATLPPEPPSGSKRPAPSIAAADSKRARIGQKNDKKCPHIWKACLAIVKKIKSHRSAGWFLVPVDGSKVHDYYDIIKNPMDLSTVIKRVEKGVYKSPLEFRDDMRLIWSNCRLYNKPNTQPLRDGEQLSNEFEKRWAESKIEQMWEAEMNPVQEHAHPQPPGFHAGKTPTDAMRQLDAEMRERLQNTRSRSDADAGQDLSFEDKRKLSIKLGELPPERLTRVLEMVEDDVKVNMDTDSEIELDIDQLSASTLRKLWDFVHSKDKPSKPSRPGQPSHSGPQYVQDRQENNEPTSQGREPKTEPNKSQDGRGSPSSSSAGSGGSESSASGSRGASDKVASAWGDAQDVARQPSMAGGDGNDAATYMISTTAERKPSILKSQSNKKDLSLKNLSQWANAVATNKTQANGKPAEQHDELWTQFVSKDEKQLAKKREEEEQQQRERQEKEKKEEKERQARMEQQAAEEAKKRDLAAQKEKELERLQGMAGTAKLTNQTDYELADMPKSDIDMNKVLGLRPIEADDDEY